jgi:hypothetical protein
MERIGGDAHQENLSIKKIKKFSQPAKRKRRCACLPLILKMRMPASLRFEGGIHKLKERTSSL